MSKNKSSLPMDRFSVDESISLYKRASGITSAKEERAEAAESRPAKVVSEKDLEQCSFRLRPEQIKALGLRHLETRENVSGMVREALESYLSDYFTDKTVNLRLSIISPKEAENAFETKGVRLSQRLIEGVRIVAASNAVEKSEIVRNAIDEYLAKKDAK